MLGQKSPKFDFQSQISLLSFLLKILDEVSNLDKHSFDNFNFWNSLLSNLFPSFHTQVNS